jgi:7beta-hydroxy-3-oxochol-24-oyl-CoA 4-desaturase
MPALTKLFSPIKINSMEVKNRIAMAPITTGWAVADGTVPDKLIDYFEARARGGVGLIILETVTVDERFPYMGQTMGLWADHLIPSFRRLTDAMHAHGAKVAPQISHPGPESFSFLQGIQPVGPSPVLNKLTAQVCHELTVEEIKEIIVQYGEAARRAREAGFDCVELHAAHSYMLAGSFLSPLRNRRTDAYGGAADERARFLMEALASMKARAGRDFPIIVRISGDEYVTGGRGLDETLYIAPKLVEAGADAFEVSGGVQPELTWRILPPIGTPLGLNVHAAAAIKQVVNVPVMAVGRINDPRMAEHYLQRGYVDMTVMGRALLADPELPNKAAEGRFDDIAPCVACSLGCIGEQMQLRSMTCVINPAVGREKEMTILPAARPKKVLVIGAGPGGLEAARVAATRGHQVTLCEKSSKLGGQLNMAALAPTKQEIVRWIQYLIHQATKAGVRIELNKEVTPELVDEMKPDAVVVASGGECLIPPIPGVERAKVVHSSDVLQGRVTPMRARVLIIGGGSTACEIADSLSTPGGNPLDINNSVTIVEMLPDIAQTEPPGSKMMLIERLHEKGVNILTSATVKEITDDGAVIVRNGHEEVIDGMNQIILACGTKSVDRLSEKLKGKVPEVYVIGDAKSPRRALEAIAEGMEVGRTI